MRPGPGDMLQLQVTDIGHQHSLCQGLEIIN